MNYILKKIIIGVSIGLILFWCKSCKVNAYSYTYTSDISHFYVNHKWDICVVQDNNLLCQDGLEQTNDVKTLQNSTLVYTTKENEYLFLREYTVHVVFNSTKNIQGDYLILPNSQGIFQKVNTSNNWYSTIYDNLIWNQSPVAVEFKYDDDTTQLIDTKLGITNTYGTLDYSNFKSVSPMIYLNNNNLNSTHIKELTIIFQSGYNYNGLLSSMVQVPTFVSGYTFTQYTQKYKNNGYLAYIPPTYSLYVSSKRNAGATGLTDGYYGTSSKFQQQDYTSNMSSINQSLSDLNRDILINSSFIGSDEFGSEQQSKFSSSFSTIMSGANSHLQNYSFTNFLNALVVDPVNNLTLSASKDFYSTTNGYHLTGDLCFAPFHQGGDNLGYFQVPFTHNKIQFPCLTRDVYSHIFYSDDYSNYSIVGSIYNGTRNSANITMGGGASFLFIWLLIQHGILYYLLVVEFVKIVKYCIDTKDAEIEVLEL